MTNYDDITPEQLATLVVDHGLVPTDIVGVQADREYAFVAFLTEDEDGEVDGRWVAAIRLYDGVLEEVLDEAEIE